VFAHGSLSVEVYKPLNVDLQQPHARDEVYVVISGNGNFYCDGNRSSFVQGDLLFVPAGIDHRFEDFTEDFSTWVIFFGPDRGEEPEKSAKSL
jgi:mannose-6-phosphate isomerase-like protein (cupin superfamily)